jgi:hypothetical protein
MKNLTTLLTIGLIGVLTRLVMLVPVTSNITPADPNSNGNAPGLASGQNDPHRNPSGSEGFIPGQESGHGNPGQCQKVTGDHDSCHSGL